MRSEISRNSTVQIRNGSQSFADFFFREGRFFRPGIEPFEKVINDYGNDNTAIANLAKSELKEMRLLGIGKTVPEIEGKDLQDKEFKISDYRGKVVLIDFWGFW